MPPASSPFTTAERGLIRYEFMVRFGQAPTLGDGIYLRVWRSGPKAGQPKIPPAVASMVERGLVVVLAGQRLGARATFTEAGVAALRELARDRRALPAEYDHLRVELGVAG